MHSLASAGTVAGGFPGAQDLWSTAQSWASVAYRPANPARRSLALMTDELRRNCHDPDREDDHDAHHGKENLRRAAFHSLRFRFSSAVR